MVPVPRPGLLLPPSSPPTALPLSRLVPPSPPLLPRPPPPAAALAAASYAPEPPGRRGWAWGPPASARTPPDAQTWPPRAGLWPRSPASASARLPAAPAVTGEAAAGSAGGWGRRLGAGGRRAERGRENLASRASGRAGPPPAPPDLRSRAVEPGTGTRPPPGALREVT